jgi:hypothetical protein
MIKPFLILNLILISTVLFAQERFYYLYDGWKINAIENFNNGYITFGSELHPYLARNIPQYNVIDSEGTVISSFSYLNDTIDGITSYRSNSYVFKSPCLFFVGSIVEEFKSYNLHPFLIKYNVVNQLVDTIITYDDCFETQAINYLLDTINNGLLICGNFVYSTDNYFPMLIFTDSFGNALTVKKYNFLPTNPIRRGVFPYQLLKLNDGGYILSCEDEIGQFTSWPDQQRAWFLRLDSQGNEMWRRTTAGVDTLCYRPFAFPTQNDDYIITWSDPVLGSAHNLNRTIWLAKMSDSGVITGKHKISDDIDGIENNWYYVNDYYQDSCGNIFLAGESSYAGFLLKVNPEGHAVWYREYECFPENDTDGDWDWTKVYGLTPTPDGGFIMGGEYMSPNSAMFPGGIQKGLAIKVDSCGCLEEGCNPLCNVSIGQQFITAQHAIIYPNPASELVNIELNTFAKTINIQVFDAEGCLWINTVENSELNNPAKHSLDVSGLAAGFYTVNVWADGKLFRGKFVKV